MASRRAQRRKHCGDKHKYPSKDTAYGAARAVTRKGLGRLEAYQCRYCGCWHIGHISANVHWTGRKRKKR